METIKEFFQSKFNKIFAVITLLIGGIVLFLHFKKDYFHGKKWLMYVLLAIPALIYLMRDKIKTQFQLD